MKQQLPPNTVELFHRSGFLLMLDDIDHPQTATVTIEHQLGHGSFHLEDMAKAKELYDVFAGRPVAAHERNSEIERSFTVKNDLWRRDYEKASAHQFHHIKQGYFFADSDGSIRIRIQDGEGTFCVKKSPNYEYEFDIAKSAAEALLNSFSPPIIEKTRHVIPCPSADNPTRKWEIDAYEGKHTGLVKAEIEIKRHDESIPTPHWLGEEVTKDRTYKDGYIAAHGIPAAPSRGVA